MQFSFLQCLVGSFLLSGAVATATWNLRNDRVEALELTVSSYEKSKDWKLPDAILKMEKASAHLDSKLSAILDNESLQEQVSALQKQLKDKDDEALITLTKSKKDLEILNSEIKNLKDELKKKKELIESLYTNIDEFTLAEGESKKLFGLDVVLSVISANKYTSNASVMIMNKAYNMYVGNVSRFIYDGKECSVSLNKITDSHSVNFTFVCK
ncbi:hypothetical protein [Aeromonas caviae]|uniref:hypothetical protein n=1 Tax=Aeromonas caviae TaxID=648 RepID=UPI0029DD73C6|nr:hypothetical protein [Aeromonas caviae]MDX7787033.1 hypothetical protein [Aeromonas caviae]